MALMNALLTRAVLVLFLFPAFSPAAAPLLEKIDLFEAGKGGYALYRIPGIIVTRSGTLLAYCEARKTAQGDWGDIDILMRRGTDGGRTWEPARKIVTPPKIAKNPAAARQNLGVGQITVNNPVAIAGRDGAVHFLYCVEYARCYYMRSDDDGKTFSEPVDITPTLDEFRPEYEWVVCATGPGHGIELSSGRLIVPVWLSTGTGGHAHRPSAVSVIYSDDAGRTWRRGQIVARHPQLINPSETIAVELADNRVMLNLRHEGKQRRRAISISPNGATDWSKPRFDEALPEPVCMAGIIRHGAPSARRLLFSNPHNPKDNRRVNLAVKLSEDDGQTWTTMRTLEDGVAGYSDLAAGPEGTIYCFYERGGLRNHYQTARLTLARFNLAWLKSAPSAMEQQ